MENVRIGENHERCDAGALDLTSSAIRPQLQENAAHPGSRHRPSEANSAQMQESVAHEPQNMSVRQKTTRVEKPARRLERRVLPEQPFYQDIKGPALGATAITPPCREIHDNSHILEFHTAEGGPFGNMACIHVPATKEWQRGVSCSGRTQALCHFLLRVLPYRCLRLSTHCEKVQALTAISKMVEKNIFEEANSLDEYHEKLRRKADNLTKILREKLIGERMVSQSM